MIYHYHGVPIYYQKAGKGPALVLLHGFLESSTIWDFLLPKLSKSHNVILIDLPGHGKSGSFPPIHTMELMAAVVHAILKKENIVRASCVGHSMGGYVALALMKSHEEILAKIILLNSTTHNDSSAKQRQRDRSILALQRNKESYIRMAIHNLVSKETLHKRPKELEQLKAEATQFSTSGIQASLEGMKVRSDSTSVLANFGGKKIIITGTTDSLIPVSVAKQIAQDTKSDLHLWEGGHMSWLENSSEMLKFSF